MKKRLNIVGLLVFLVVSAACDKKDDPEVTSGEVVSLMFGVYAGEIPGTDYSDIYLLNETSLFQDTTNKYPNNGFFDGEFVLLEQEKFELTQDLMDYFPMELLVSEETFIGCPDCADGGGIYVEYKTTDYHGRWNIDNELDAIPEYLHEFVTKILEKIVLLEN